MIQRDDSSRVRSEPPSKPWQRWRWFIWALLLVLVAATLGGKAWLRRNYLTGKAQGEQQAQARSKVAERIDVALGQTFPAATEDQVKGLLAPFGTPKVIRDETQYRIREFEFYDPPSGYRFGFVFKDGRLLRRSWAPAPVTPPDLSLYNRFTRWRDWAVNQVIIIWFILLVAVPSFWRLHRRLGEMMLALTLFCGITAILDNAPGGFVHLNWKWRAASFWGACGMLAVSCLILLWPRRIREDHPQCRKCQYDLTGNVSGICPECGTPIPPASYNADDIARKLAVMRPSSQDSGGENSG